MRKVGDTGFNRYGSSWGGRWLKKTVDFYTYRATRAADVQEFIGLCTEFPSASWFVGMSEKAL